MRLLTLPIVLAAVLAAAPATAAAKAPLCERKAGDTLHRGAGVRVFQRVTESRTDPDADIARIYACKVRSRSVRRIETFRNNLDLRYVIHELHVGGGRWLVIDLTASGGVSESRELLEYDLTSGKRLFSYSTEDTETTPMVVTAAGAVALLTTKGAVLGFDSAGRRVLEAAGASDLAAAGFSVYWTAGGLAKRAVLDGRPSGSIEEPG
jgi:hypothetical protein